MGIFSRNKYIEKSQFPFIIKNLAKSLEALREDFIYGSLTQLKREGVDISMISKAIPPGSELEDELKGFQLTSMIGIAWNCIKDPKEKIDFDDLLSEYMGAEEGTRGWEFRDRYLFCQGDMDRLTKTLSLHVHNVIGSPSPRMKYLLQFTNGANILIGMCQAETYRICGDSKREKKIRKIMMHQV